MQVALDLLVEVNTLDLEQYLKAFEFELRTC